MHEAAFDFLQIPGNTTLSDTSEAAREALPCSWPGFRMLGGTCIGLYWATCISRKRPPYSLFKLHHSQRNVGLCRRSIFYTYLWLCASKMSRLEPEGMKFHIVKHIPKTCDSVGCILLYTSRCSNKNSTPKAPLHTPLLFPLSFMIKSERLQVRRNRPVGLFWW